MVAIAGLITLVLSIVWEIVRYYHGVKYQKQKVWDEFKDLETKYRQALACGDPVRAAEYNRRMRELRQKYSYLNG
jgi:flagellar biosynthesis protein FlhB